MKDLFPGHFKDSEKELKKAWDESLFVFDANILLNLYRYSDSTRSEFIRILDKMKERIWLPHRAAEEYLNNRLVVISQQEKSYDETKNSIDNLKQTLKNSRQHPFVSRDVMDNANGAFDKLLAELDSNKLTHTKRINDDEIQDAIAAMFESRVGQPYDNDELKNLIVEGESRYKEKIPPGFKDGGKGGYSNIFVEKCKKYGDLIVWKQVIDKAITENQSIVLVTDDKKEDWWEKVNGKTLGPRPELVKEFRDKTNKSFHMYKADRFLELARVNLGENVSDEIVEEIREARRLADPMLSVAQLQYLDTQKDILAEDGKKLLIELSSIIDELNLYQKECDDCLATLEQQNTLLKIAILRENEDEVKDLNDKISATNGILIKAAAKVQNATFKQEMANTQLNIIRSKYTDILQEQHKQS
ncbi:PIN-like domain-containing protein [Agarivorans sp. DSG3-1]|uniref:PIN-like domain-containing protein n=1 Tax=Agarivorans sp. DSG3-1 TaxID=3342249 RepID=UPI00398F620F